MADAGVTVEEVRARFLAFAEREAAGFSPLYEHLALHIAEDPEVAGLLTSAQPGFAMPTLLLAVAHRLVQAEPVHPLADYYPTLSGSFGVDGRTWPLFREFLLERADKARALVAARTTQTNEVRRAALLYPAVALAAKQARGPVALLEVGCSAGLLLGLDRYGYRYQTEQAGQLAAGPTKTALGLHCALELAPGAELPVVPKKLTVAARIGLDRAPVDAQDEDELAWLEACVWADQPERARLLRLAATVQRKDQPRLVAGDAVDDLAGAAALAEDDLPLVVITSHVLSYLSRERRAEFLVALGELAARRPLWWVSVDGYSATLEPLLPGRDDLTEVAGRPAFGVLGLTHWSKGAPVARALARTGLHGQRLEWLAG
ncbi:DUF2332 domain-containing protein [Solihabitans fulvus]|uniref:DUF2332 domain-containing protein n=1 Tax=Solihabitans fulvus TaxID=1892852 RepID=A0A5B2XMB3_9PSEU|nr:DUF2332 domain-containing protein [Solihabitans fulvus]KAA2264080.1 DUF2332 domain-containing protein [Solihabitans fulvus]